MSEGTESKRKQKAWRPATMRAVVLAMMMSLLPSVGLGAEALTRDNYGWGSYADRERVVMAHLGHVPRVKAERRGGLYAFKFWSEAELHFIEKWLPVGTPIEECLVYFANRGFRAGLSTPSEPRKKVFLASWVEERPWMNLFGIFSGPLRFVTGTGSIARSITLYYDQNDPLKKIVAHKSSVYLGGWK